MKTRNHKSEAADYRRSRSATRKVTFQTQEPEEETAKDDLINYSQANK